MTARKAGAGLFGAFVGAWIGRAAFKWILDLPGDWPVVLSIATALIGAAICVAGEQETQPKRDEEQPRKVGDTGP
jgi:uncharacterized membrane protein YeaQ/YmgE (transglycosylase-associated protein family)